MEKVITFSNFTVGFSKATGPFYNVAISHDEFPLIVINGNLWKCPESYHLSRIDINGGYLLSDLSGFFKDLHLYIDAIGDKIFNQDQTEQDND